MPPKTTTKPRPSDVSQQVRKPGPDRATAAVEVPIEDRVQAIMAAFSHPWRWFAEGAWIVLEPPGRFITAETMQYLHQHTDVHTVEAVFRAMPSPGIYLRFHLRGAPGAPPK